ncbi:MAG: hypothetical protein K0S53_2327 [Bacteroidetes bacterium]|jgi:hypothetical protein|nr:hypothetical protein [Bacteroidota bacterium]MDF2450576.1 hypothetical protein [Bacteroidota bacterium]
MNDLKLIQQAITGLVHIKENSQFNSIQSNMVILEENITARLFGDIGNIILKKGSSVYIHGIVTGSVENQGGAIHIFSN